MLDRGGVFPVDLGPLGVPGVAALGPLAVGELGGFFQEVGIFLQQDGGQGR